MTLRGRADLAWGEFRVVDIGLDHRDGEPGFLDVVEGGDGREDLPGQARHHDLDALAELEGAALLLRNDELHAEVARIRDARHGLALRRVLAVADAERDDD